MNSTTQNMPPVVKDEVVDSTDCDSRNLSPSAIAMQSQLQGMPLTPVTPGSMQLPVTPGTMQLPVTPGNLMSSGMLETDPNFEPVSRNRSNTWPLCWQTEDSSMEGAASNTGTRGLGLSPHSHPPKKHTSRKNPWGNRSYADLIADAISSSRGGRATLSQIYDWMVQNIIYFKDKGDSNSSAGWKNSIRHNLSLHNRFMRVQNEGTGKSSWWVINPGARPGKSTRRRANTLETGGRPEKKRGRAKKKPIDPSMMIRPPQALPTPPSPSNNLPERVESPPGSLSHSLTGYQPSPQDYRNSSSPLVDERHDSQQLSMSPRTGWDYYHNSVSSQGYDYSQECYPENLAVSMAEALRIGGPAFSDYNGRIRFRNDAQIQSDSRANNRVDSRDYAHPREAQARAEHLSMSISSDMNSEASRYMSQSHYNYNLGYGGIGHQMYPHLHDMQNPFSNYHMSPPQTGAVQQALSYSPSSHDGFQQSERSFQMATQAFSPSQSACPIHQHVVHSRQSPLDSQSFSPNQSSSHLQHVHPRQSPAQQASFSSSPISTPATSPVLHSHSGITQSPPSLLSPGLTHSGTEQSTVNGYDTSTEATIRVALTHRNNSNTNASGVARTTEGGANDIEDVDFVHGGLDCNVDEVIRHEMQYNEEFNFDFANGVSMYSHVNHSHMQGYSSGHREMTPQLSASHASVVPNYVSPIVAGNHWVR